MDDLNRPLSDADRLIFREQAARDIAEVTAKVDQLTADVSGLVAAWKNATFAIAAAKFIASVIMGASALWYVVTHPGGGK